MRSNLRLRSNVYLRQRSIALRDDKAFVPQLRGESAVRKLLGMYGIPSGHRRHNDSEVIALFRQHKLTHRQLNMIKWELRCIRCDCIPVGVTFRDAVEFRCSEPGCAQYSTPVRSILIPDSVLVAHPPSTAWEKILSGAIQSCRGVPPDLPTEQPRTRVVVRVAPTADWIYSDGELSALMVYGLKHQD